MDKMKRLVRPLVYILGFSVFSACTMTKTMPVADVPLSSETPEFVVTLSGGARLEVSSATVNHEGIRGVISVEDAERLETYFPGWRSAPLMRMSYDGSLVESNEHTVVIPRSDVSKVQITSTNGWATALVVVGVALASLVLIVAHVGITPLPVDPHSH
jgi:hypothetical protein